MIGLGRSERMSGLLPPSWMKDEELEEQDAGCIDTMCRLQTMIRGMIRGGK